MRPDWLPAIYSAGPSDLSPPGDELGAGPAETVALKPPDQGIHERVHHEEPLAHWKPEPLCVGGPLSGEFLDLYVKRQVGIRLDFVALGEWHDLKPGYYWLRYQGRSCQSMARLLVGVAFGGPAEVGVDHDR